MELRHLRYFIAVAEELNFRRAAERVRVAQPSLSEQIRQLEEEIGVRLLERNTHRVALTPAGEGFLESSRKILLAAEEGAHRAKRIAGGEAGRLTIGFVPSLGFGLLPRILKAYRKKFPDVELRLFEMDTAQQIRALRSRELDLGLVGLGLPEPDMGDVQLTTVREEQLMAVLPQDHRLAGRRRLNLAGLAKEKFLLGGRVSAPVYNPWLIVLCQQAGFQPQVVQEQGQPIAVMNYVAAGLGISILPAQYSRLSMAGLSFVPLADPVPKYRYCAVWLPGTNHSTLEHFRKVAVREGGE